MARSYNRIILVGNLGRAPDIQETSNGTKVAHVSMATNRNKPDGSERTDWHRLTFWGKQAQIAHENLAAGSRVMIEGTLEYSSYERDGVTIPTADIHVKEFLILSQIDEEDG